MLIIHPTLTHSRSRRTLTLKKFDANTAVRIWKRPRWISILFSLFPSLPPFTVLYHLNINNGHYRHFHFSSSSSSPLSSLIERKRKNRGYLNMSEPLFYFSSISMFELESIDLTLRLRPRIYPAGKKSERRCLHWTPANKTSISSYIHTHTHTYTSNACSAMLFTLNKVVLDRLMYATIEQHDCLSCRRGFSHILIEMFKIDWSSNIISFAPHLMVNKSNVAQVKCPPFFSDSHFPILNRYVYRYSWFLSLSTMCTNNSLRWTRTKEKKEREREKKMTKVQASVDLIYSNQDYKRKKNLQRWERKMSVRMKCICSSGISLKR